MILTKIPKSPKTQARGLSLGPLYSGCQKNKEDCARHGSRPWFCFSASRESPELHRPWTPFPWYISIFRCSIIYHLPPTVSFNLYISMSISGWMVSLWVRMSFGLSPPPPPDGSRFTETEALGLPSSHTYLPLKLWWIYDSSTSTFLIYPSISQRIYVQVGYLPNQMCRFSSHHPSFISVRLVCYYLQAFHVEIRCSFSPQFFFFAYPSAFPFIFWLAFIWMVFPGSKHTISGLTRTYANLWQFCLWAVCGLLRRPSMRWIR